MKAPHSAPLVINYRMLRLKTLWRTQNTGVPTLRCSIKAWLNLFAQTKQIIIVAKQFKILNLTQMKILNKYTDRNIHSKSRIYLRVKFISAGKLLTLNVTLTAFLRISPVTGLYVNSTANSKFLTILTSKKVIGCAKTVCKVIDVQIELLVWYLVGYVVWFVYWY